MNKSRKILTILLIIIIIVALGASAYISEQNTKTNNQARRISDEIIHIYNGNIVEAAKTEDFFENPKSEITRKFINGELDF